MRNTVAIHDWDGREYVLAEAVRRSPFDRIVLTVEDAHVTWRSQNVIDAVDIFKEAGQVEVYLDPWGVSGQFAGEAYGGRDTVGKWMQLAAQTRADGILIDEPLGDAWEHTMENVIVLRDLYAPGKRLIAGLEPERDLYKWAAHRSIDEVAVSAYFFPPRINRLTTSDVWRQVREWDKDFPPNASVWVQTWGLPPEKGWLPVTLIKQWQSLGRDVNVWSWDATRTVSKIAPANPDAVWAGVIDAFETNGKD